MRLAVKLIPFFIIFSILFYFIRDSDAYNTRILLADISGVPWLYAVIGTMFAMLAAFAVQKEWGEWTALTEAVRGEVDGLEKLYLWSSHFPESIRVKIHGNIQKYLEIMVKNKLQYSEKGERSQELEDVLVELNANIYDIFNEAPQLMPTTFALLSSILGHRSSRLHHASEHMPRILKNTLEYAAFLLIVLSIFIGIKNIWLDYVFTAGVASLTYSIFIVLVDLDNPLKPGDWHLTTDAYELLLKKISPAVN